MDNISEQKRIAAYRNSDSSVKKLYGNLELGGFLGISAEKYNLSEPSKKIFIDIVGDIILGLHEKSQLVSLLTAQLKISDPDGENLAREISKFLDINLPGPNVPKADSTVPEKLELRPEGVPVPKPVTTEEVVSKPLTREDVLDALASKRTMASDIESVKNSQENEGV